MTMAVRTRDTVERVIEHRRSGFTLLEVMVAIVLTSLVVLLAYAAAQVSFDARARLGANLRTLQGARAVRALLQDALRNARTPQRQGDAGFTLKDGRLSFVAAGGAPPLDPDYDWLVTLQPRSGGLDLSAAFVESTNLNYRFRVLESLVLRGAVPLHPSVHGVGVLQLQPGGGRPLDEQLL